LNSTTPRGISRSSPQARRGCDAPATGSVALVFLVDHLADEHRRLIEAGIVVSEIETSVEGYRAVRLSDPAGHPIQLFEWIRPV
jgi:hypothetical protein